MGIFSCIQKSLKTCCPCCFWLLCTEHEEHKKLKGVVGFFYGILLGTGTFSCLIWTTMTGCGHLVLPLHSQTRSIRSQVRALQVCDLNPWTYYLSRSIGQKYLAPVSVALLKRYPWFGCQLKVFIMNDEDDILWGESPEFLYFAVLSDLEFGRVMTLCIGIIITIILAIGNACSTQTRCITLLTFPSICGKSGRGVLKTIVLAYVLGGPFMNISNNAKEAVRVFGCTTTLANNLSKTRYELMVKPFQEALRQMKRDANEVADTLQSIQEIIEPIVEEIEGVEEIIRLRAENDFVDDLQEDSKRSQEIEEKYKIDDKTGTIMDNDEKNPGEKYEREYKRKLEYRCQDVISKGTIRCQSLFYKAYEKCHDQVNVIVAWLICWPMKLTFICNLAEVFGGNSLCDPSKEILPGFGEGYETLKNIQLAMRENLQELNIQLEIKNPSPEVNVKSASDVARKITKTFQDKKNIFDVVILFIKRLLSLIFLRIIYKAAQYHDKYLTDVEYDNKYITTYFCHIDERRRRRGQKTLLPMKKIERQNFVDPYAVLPLSEERKRILGQSFKLVLEMITATTFILLDRLFFETLDIVSKHALVEYTQSGEHDMSIVVKGTGLIANLVRSIVKGFNFKRRVKVIHSNRRCLPRPAILSNYYLYKIYGTYFLIWMFILLESYTQRMNRAICAYFYKKREKKRVLYLYNETLKRRIRFLRYMKVRIRRQAREINLSFEANILLALRLKNRKKFDWLRYFPMGKRKCLICGQPEPTKRGAFYECGIQGCNFVHCWECWRDVGQICYGCNPVDIDEDSAEEDENLFF